jgi:CubicO group peptidase (beta-lactamase class C family)
MRLTPVLSILLTPAVCLAQLFEPDLPPDGFLPRATPAQVGLDAAALDKLVKVAETQRSDALIVIKDNQVVVERSFGKSRDPIELMSVTKSVVALAIGLLLDEKKLTSVDQPLSTWYPEWKDGPRAKVTLRHVLTHTSGIEHGTSASAMNAEADRLKYARARPLTDEPGKTFSYNNEATQLLSGVILALAGKPVHKYLQEKLFTPIGIADCWWKTDKAGNYQTFYGLQITPRDLARIGQLMLHDGKWDGRQLLSQQFVRDATTPFRDGAEIGWLWWITRTNRVWIQTQTRLEALAKAGFTALAKLAPLTGKTYTRWFAYWMDAGALLSPEERTALADLQWRMQSPLEEKPGKALGFHANGWLGQHLIVIPSQKLVAVRLRRQSDDLDPDVQNQRFGMNQLTDLLLASLPKP